MVGGAEPDDTEPDRVGPGEAGAGDGEPGQARPGGAGAGDTELDGGAPSGAGAGEAELVARAIGGEVAAVEAVLRRVQDPLYRLALRMTGNRADAEDATQEILLRVLTHLATWRAEAALLTWAYRIGLNHLLNQRRRSPQERGGIDLEIFANSLLDGLATAEHRGPEAELLATEVRLQCSQAMLQCLDRAERVGFVLAEVFELSSADAAWILGTTPEAYRKRLQRTKARLGRFLTANCGRVDTRARCRCTRRITAATERGRIDPNRPAFTGHPVTPGGRDATAAERQMVRLHDAAAVFRAHPDYAAPAEKVEAVAALVRSGRFPLLE
ncbi:RNA polymerase sigma factor [Nocardia sp. NPDC050697]|uniref:RNA polymerase sigma factor n=1 Tax=Nocardia sp. NPDC050697 TaxID=3155158 RepID=UPI0033F08095